MKLFSAGTIFDLPVAPDLAPTERLLKCEMSIQSAKNSTLPWFGVVFVKVIGSHLAPLAKLLLNNNIIPMGLTSFPGPAKEIVWKGRKALAADFLCGTLPGVAGNNFKMFEIKYIFCIKLLLTFFICDISSGVGFMVLSYGDYIRISATAEHAVMERDELNKLIEFVCDEIHVLRSISNSGDTCITEASKL